MRRVSALVAVIATLALMSSGSSKGSASPGERTWTPTAIPRATLAIAGRGPCVSALSSDGRVAVVADPRGVYLFRTSSEHSWGSLEKPTATLRVPRSAAVNLTAVATSGDGTTVLVAAGAVANDPAAVYVFRASSPRAWKSANLPMARLTGAADQAGFGSGVALSSDGRTALVGDPGGADVFHVAAPDSWRGSSKPTATLVADPAGAARSDISTAVALSADGKTALIGATSLDTFVGAAYVFRAAAADAWASSATPVAVLTDGAAGVFGDGFAAAVALSPDGMTALVGAPNLAFGPNGAAYFFQAGSPDAWVSTSDPEAVVGRTNIQKRVGKSGAVPGWSVALSEVGTALVGEPSVLRGPGAADVIQAEGQEQTKLTNAAGPPGDLFGASVGVSSDGSTALVSSARASFIYTQAGDRGATYCYVPYVEGKKLPAAKKALESTHCRPGKVTRVGGSRSRSGHVVWQTPKPGDRLVKGARVSLRMQ